MTTVPATISERVPAPGGGMPGAPASAGLSPADLMRMLRARLVLIIVLSVFFMAIGVGAFLLWYIKFPSYAAFAVIECIANAPRDAYDPKPPRQQRDEHERFLQSEALFVKMPSQLIDVLQKPEVKDTNWFRTVAESERLEELEEDLRCWADRDSNYIQVQMATRSPEDPHKIVRAVVDTYLNNRRERASDQYRNEQVKLEQEEAALKQQIQDQIDQIRAFTEQMPPGVLGQGEGQRGMTVVEAQLLDAQHEVTRLELQTAELEGIMQIYENPQGPGVTPEDRQLVELNPQVQMLQNQVYALEQELGARKERFGDRHRSIETIRTRIRSAQEQLREVRQQKLQESIELKMEQARTAWANSQHALMLAYERLREAEAKQADVERKLAEYQRLNDDLEFLKETQKKVSDYVRDLRRIIAERSAITIEAVQMPQPPRERAQPQWYYLPGFAFLAIALAVGIGLLLELLDTSVRTARDVVRHLSVPILGTVPDADDEEVDIEEPAMAVRDFSHSMMAEAFRAIRTALQFSAPADRERTVVVTSPRPEDGKTTVACNLAYSLALGGRRILLVDANFRRPMIHRLFTLDGQEGLSNVLVGSRRYTELIRKTQLGNLDILPSGPAPPNPAERLGSSLMRQFLEEACSSYDQIIIDAPPALLASDASVLGTLVDGTVVVLRANENSRGIAQRTVTVLSAVNAHIFGIVLNAAQAQRGGYFREQLRTFYDYQEDYALASAGGGAALPGGDSGRSIESDRNGVSKNDEEDTPGRS